jgi:serine/threonine-protein kinase RsbW
VKHSHPPATLVELTLTRDGGAVAVLYADDGPAFDPTQRAAVDVTLSAAERQIGGLGIHFILTTMTGLQYERRDGRNVTRFSRRLAS